MAISNNSVIHYTKTIENIKGILKENFKLKYCLEKINGVDIAIPMVCFCDIPFPEIDNHVLAYGRYGIGFTKKWAELKNLNPVLYINDNSHVDQAIIEFGSKITESIREHTWDKEWHEFYVALISFMKPIEGPVIIEGKEVNVYHYDEKEWRYVPSKSELSQEFIGEGNDRYFASSMIYGRTYINDKDFFNNSIGHLHLNFSHKDISYIIVSKEEEIPEISDYIKKTYLELNTDEAEILSKKICSLDGIPNVT